MVNARAFLGRKIPQQIAISFPSFSPLFLQPGFLTAQQDYSGIFDLVPWLTTAVSQYAELLITDRARTDVLDVVVVVVLFKVVPQTGVDAFFYTCRRLQN